LLILQNTPVVVIDISRKFQGSLIHDFQNTLKWISNITKIWVFDATKTFQNKLRCSVDSEKVVIKVSTALIVSLAT